MTLVIDKNEVRIWKASAVPSPEGCDRAGVSTFAFDLDDKWTRDVSHISRRHLLVRSHHLIFNTFAVQKCSYDLGLEHKIYVLGNIAREAGEMCVRRDRF